MPFKTKLDYSDNRQIKQHVETRTVLSGATSFGVPFSALTTGPNLLTSGITQTLFSVISTFSGNSGTTIYNWFDSRMSLGEIGLSALTPSNSATTQNTGIIFTGSFYTLIDGNNVATAYTGLSFNLNVTGMTNLGGGNYSGTVLTNTLKFYSANTLDFTGRTIWVDVAGITRTKDLIITTNPIIGNVWTCINSEGKGGWNPSSGGTSGSNVNVTGGTYNNSTGTATFTNNTGGTFTVTGFTTGSTGGSSSIAYGYAAGQDTTSIGANADVIFDLGATPFPNSGFTSVPSPGGTSFVVATSGDYEFNFFVTGTHAAGATTPLQFALWRNGAVASVGGNAFEFSSDLDGVATAVQICRGQGIIKLTAGDVITLHNRTNTVTDAVTVTSVGGGVGAGRPNRTLSLQMITSGGSGGSGSTSYWSASTGTNAIIVVNSGSIASGILSLGEGYFTTASGNYSHAEGYITSASGDSSHSEGYSTKATNSYSHAEGAGTLASGNSSHAEGNTTTASNNSSHSEGGATTASGAYSHAEGNTTIASGNWSHSEGSGTTASGNFSHAEGAATTAIGLYSHAEGAASTAIGNFSHAEGNSIVIGLGGHAEGSSSAFGDVSHSEGQSTSAMNIYSHAEGYYTIASGQTSHSEGDTTTAIGLASHAEGYSTRAIGGYSHAQGEATIASGLTSHAEGLSTTAIGDRSHAGGYSTISSGLTSFVHGENSQANGDYSIVLGRNITGNTTDYVYVSSLNVKTVGSSAFVNDIRIDANGNLTTNTSDIRFKENITLITNALEKIKQLRGISYQWKDRSAGGDDLKLGFIAQEVEAVEPILAFTNKVDGYKGIHIDGIIPLLVEAVKELASGVTTSGNIYLETQTILAEDNNIELNYSGNSETAIGGGIRVLHAIGQDLASEIVTDSDGNWITNNDFKPKAFTIPTYTPTSSNNEYGNEGNITKDDNYLYVKTKTGWKRSNLENF